MHGRVPPAIPCRATPSPIRTLKCKQTRAPAVRRDLCALGRDLLSGRIGQVTQHLPADRGVRIKQPLCNRLLVLWSLPLEMICHQFLTKRMGKESSSAHSFLIEARPPSAEPACGGQVGFSSCWACIWGLSQKSPWLTVDKSTWWAPDKNIYFRVVTVYTNTAVTDTIGQQYGYV
jgi:hypothetical protein